MSTPSCFLLLLLCLSLQACSARRLVAVDSKHHKIDNILHFSIKNDMKKDRKNNSVAVLQAKSSSSKELRSMKVESIEESHGYNVTQKLEDAEVKYHKTIVEIEKKKNPSVAVSWRVPHKKHGEKNPVQRVEERKLRYQLRQELQNKELKEPFNKILGLKSNVDLSSA